MNGPLPEKDYMASSRSDARRWKNEDKEFAPLNFLLTVGALLTMVLLLLIAMQFALVDPDIRFGLLLIGLGIAAIVLIGRSYVSRGGDRFFIVEDRQSLEGRNPLQSTVEELDLSFEGNPRDVDVGSILADPMGELYIRCQPIHAAAQEP